MPVIPTKPGALGQLLNTAPELLERVSTLTERLTELLSDRNQESIAGILDHLEEVSRSLAERGPEIAATLAEARVAIRQAGDAAERVGQLAGTTSDMLDRDGRPLINDLRHTLRSADQSMTQLQAAIGDARPGIQAFSNQTLPEVGQLIRDLRATSESLHDITDRLNQRGVGGIIGGPAPAGLSWRREEKLIMRPRIFAAAACALALSACLGGGHAPDHLLTLTAAETRPVAQPRNAGPNEAVTVTVPTVPQALRTTRIPVYLSETTVQYLKDADWVENPGPLFAPAARRDDRGAHRPRRARSEPVQPRSRHQAHRPAAPLRPRSGRDAGGRHL